MSEVGGSLLRHKMVMVMVNVEQMVSLDGKVVDL